MASAPSCTELYPSGPRPPVRIPRPARLRASRRRETGARKHDGGVRQRHGARQRRRSNATCTCRATACRWSFTTRRSTAPPTRPGPVGGAHGDGAGGGRCRLSIRRRDGGFPFRGQGIGVPTLEEVLRRVPGRPRHHRDEARRSGAGARGDRRRAPTRTPSIASVSARSTAAGWTSSARRRRRCDQRVGATKRAGRCIARGAGGRFAPPRPYCAFQVPERAGRLRVDLPAFLAQAHRDGARVDVWVVDAAEDIERLFALGRRRRHHRSPGHGGVGATMRGMRR